MMMMTIVVVVCGVAVALSDMHGLYQYNDQRQPSSHVGSISNRARCHCAVS